MLGAAESYAVSVRTQPPGQTCTVSSGTGTASANVTNVAVACTSTFAVGGLLAGLASGSTVIQQNNAGDNLSLAANGAFTFATRINAGSGFAVTVKTQPANQVCTVATGTGSNVAADVTGVRVTCVLSVSPVSATVRANGNTAGTLAGGGTPSGATFSLASNGANGTAVVSADGRYTYTPRAGFTGTDSFSYQVCLPAPNQAACDTATVTVAVGEQEIKPIPTLSAWVLALLPLLLGFAAFRRRT